MKFVHLVLLESCACLLKGFSRTNANIWFLHIHDATADQPKKVQFNLGNIRISAILTFDNYLCMNLFFFEKPRATISCKEHWRIAEHLCASRREAFYLLFSLHLLWDLMRFVDAIINPFDLFRMDLAINNQIPWALRDQKFDETGMLLGSA